MFGRKLPLSLFQEKISSFFFQYTGSASRLSKLGFYSWDSPPPIPGNSGWAPIAPKAEEEERLISSRCSEHLPRTLTVTCSSPFCHSPRKCDVYDFKDLRIGSREVGKEVHDSV